MADYIIEIKEQRVPAVSQQTGLSAGKHFAANVAAAAPAANAWGDAIAAAAITAGVNQLWAILHNRSAATLAFASSNDASPTAYHAVLPGQTREVAFDPTVALRVKELA